MSDDYLRGRQVSARTGYHRRRHERLRGERERCEVEGEHPLLHSGAEGDGDGDGIGMAGGLPIPQVREPGPPELRKVVAADPLGRHLIRNRTRGGRAAGPDGVSPRHVSVREAAAIGRDLAAAALGGGYRPSETKEVRQPKAKGGFRTINIPSFASRGLHGRLAEAVTPYCERLFDSLGVSHGWRPEYDGFGVLADVARAADRGRCWIRLDDVTKAFDNIAPDLAASVLRRHFGNRPGLAELLETAVRAHPRERREVGIPQGDPLSALVTNLVFHDLLDVPFVAAGLPATYLRYADNLTLLAETREEIERAHALLAELLGEQALTLKGEDGPAVDLRAPEVRPVLLGFELEAPGGVFDLFVPGSAHRRLAEKLRKACLKPDPAAAADEVAIGWAAFFGAAATDLEDFIEAARRTARAVGCREVDRERLEAVAGEARETWLDRIGRCSEARPCPER